MFLSSITKKKNKKHKKAIYRSELPKKGDLREAWQKRGRRCF